MTGWSGERFENQNAVSGSDRIDQDARADAGPGRQGPAEPASDPWDFGASSELPAGRALPSRERMAGDVVAGSAAFGWSPIPKVRKRRRRWLVLSAAAGATLLAVAAFVVVTLVDVNRGQAGGSAGEAVKSYLEALARGDAATALSYGIDQPTNAEFLTGDILKRQIAQWPIRNIKILHDNSGAPEAALSMAHVHVVATFGSETSDAVVDLRLDHKRWKLASAAIKFTPGLGASMGNAAAKTVTLFGKLVSDSTVYVFPGWIDIGTTNPYMMAMVQPLLLDQLTMAAPYWVHPDFALSDRGRDVVRAQLAATIGECQKSNLLAPLPLGCPVHLDPSGSVEGNTESGAADVSAVKLDTLEPYRLTLNFSGQITVPVIVTTPDGKTRRSDATGFVSGTADMAKTPPALTFR